MKIFNNKKGFSVGYTWVFGLVTLFGLGVLYIVFNQVFTAHLVPIIETQVNASNIDLATKVQINAEITKYMIFFRLLPFILFFVVIIYMFLAAWRKEGESY